jgi:hypothetical protein
MRNAFCADCKYYDETVPNQIGECRRYAPRPIMRIKDVDIDGMREWPSVISDDWCGEHEVQNDH